MDNDNYDYESFDDVEEEEPEGNLYDEPEPDAVGTWDGKSKPTEEMFEDYSDFVEAQTSWKVDQKAGEIRQQAPPLGPPPTVDMVALTSGTPADKEKSRQKAGCLDRYREFELEAERCRARGDEKAAANYEARMKTAALDYDKLGTYEYEDDADKMADLKLHKHILENPDSYEQGEINLINSRSPSQIFMLKIQGKNHPIRLPDGKTASQVFQEIENRRDTSATAQREFLKGMGLSIPETEVEQSQAEYEAGRPKSEYTSAMDGAQFKTDAEK